MAELSVVGHALWDRAGPPPTLTVIDDPHRWCAVEIAAAPAELKGPLAHASGRCWASWQGGLLRPGPITVPEEAWSPLRGARRVYYRAHSSASETAWVDHQVTVRDAVLASAPSIRLCDVWTSGDKELLEQPVQHVFEAVNRHRELHRIVAEEPVAMLICLHRFSPKRPVHLSQLEVVVVVAGGDTDRLRILVERFDYESMSELAARVQTISGSLTSTEAEPGGLPIPPQAVSWPQERCGPFIVLRNNSPAPEESGGTCVFMSRTGTCVYWATTEWNGAPQVLVPA